MHIKLQKKKTRKETKLRRQVNEVLVFATVCNCRVYRIEIIIYSIGRCKSIRIDSVGQIDLNRFKRFPISTEHQRLFVQQ